MTAVALVLTLTAYAPACGGINGSLRNFYADGGSRPQPDHHLVVAACGPRFELGTVLRIHGAEGLGVQDVVCRDRGSAVRGVDVLVLTGEGCRADRAMARQIGRRAVRAEVVRIAAPMGAKVVRS
jgi:hypothetical protein